MAQASKEWAFIRVGSSNSCIKGKPSFSEILESTAGEVASLVRFQLGQGGDRGYDPQVGVSLLVTEA